MHVRRALLLFAIVLGMAALAASLSRPREEREQPADTTPMTADSPTLAPAPGSGAPEALAFDAAREQRRTLELGVAATVEVSVEEPGQVDIPVLGLSGSAEPLTPARFEVLPLDEGDYELVFTPASGDEARTAGTLQVVSPDR